MSCVKCSGETSGFVCAVCGEESNEHNQTHEHQEGDQGKYVMGQCAACGLAEVHCTC